jgi:hypothetical protein
LQEPILSEIFLWLIVYSLTKLFAVLSLSIWLQILALCIK